MSFTDPIRLTDEVSAFLDACPRCSSSTEADNITQLSKSVPTLRSLIENNVDILDERYRSTLEHCLYDTVTDGEAVESFVEFGLWILDNCITTSPETFFASLDNTKISEFLNKERFRYSIVRKRNATALLRGDEHTFCEKEWCSREGILLCSRCLHSVNRRVAYCSRDCQMSHWATHRRICGRDRAIDLEEFNDFHAEDAFHLVDYNFPRS